MLQDYHIFYILKNHVPRVTACLKIKAMAQEAQRATSHTSQDRDHEIERAKRKRLKAISTHLQHHVVWSRDSQVYCEVICDRILNRTLVQ